MINQIEIKSKQRMSGKASVSAIDNAVREAGTKKKSNKIKHAPVEHKENLPD